MHKILHLARREYLSAVRTKGFIIGLVLAPLLMSGGFIGIAVLKDHVDTTDQRLAVLDHSGLLTSALIQAAARRNAQEVHDPKTGKKVRPAYLIEVVPSDREAIEAQRLQLSDRIRQHSLHAFLEIGADVLPAPAVRQDSSIRYYARNGALDDLRRWLATPLNDELRRRRLLEAGIEPKKVEHVFKFTPVESLGLVSRDSQTGAIRPAERRNEAEAVLVPLTTQILMFMLFMMGAAPLLQSVMEEKNQRIAEVILGSVTPFQFMCGKLLGGVAVALTGSAVYGLGVILSLRSMSLTAVLPLQILPWFFAFLLPAVLMFGAWFAALGSACSDAKDAQSLQLPAMLPVMIPMFLLGPLLKEPHSPLATSLSFFPPFTPSLMLLRLSTPGGVPEWQPWTGLAGVWICMLASIWIGGRIFRVGILMQGKAPKFSELARWAWRG